MFVSDRRERIFPCHVRAMLRAHAPQYVPMSRRLFGSLITKKYYEVQAIMNKILKDTIGSITTDGWASTGGNTLTLILPEL